MTLPSDTNNPYFGWWNDHTDEDNEPDFDFNLNLKLSDNQQFDNLDQTPPNPPMKINNTHNFLSSSKISIPGLNRVVAINICELGLPPNCRSCPVINCSNHGKHTLRAKKHPTLKEYINSI